MHSGTWCQPHVRPRMHAICGAYAQTAAWTPRFTQGKANLLMPAFVIVLHLPTWRERGSHVTPNQHSQAWMSSCARTRRSSLPACAPPGACSLASMALLVPASDSRPMASVHRLLVLRALLQARTHGVSPTNATPKKTTAQRGTSSRHSPFCNAAAAARIEHVPGADAVELHLEERIHHCYCNGSGS